jgi:magnesium transporter
MARFIKNKNVAMGNIPGEPVFIGTKKMEKPDIHVIEYNNTDLNEYDIDPAAITTLVLNKKNITWINVNGLHDIDVLKALADMFSIHPLTLEDIVNTGQRSKIEEYDEHIYIVTKMMRIDKTDQQVHSEQLSVILGENFVITFQERPGDVFNPVRHRIRNHKGRIKDLGSDYLTYSLLDCVVDHYTMIIEHYGEEIEDLENDIRDNPDRSLLEKINNYKREMNYLRKSIRPTREGITALSRLETDLISEEIQPFIKDLLDSVTQSLEITDTYREMLSDHLDIYNSGINNRLNEIMKVLTIFSAIFIPLTFIAGIYGTNFDFLPELHFKYSYPIFWGVLMLIAAIMLRFFKKRKWL